MNGMDFTASQGRLMVKCETTSWRAQDACSVPHRIRMAPGTAGIEQARDFGDLNDGVSSFTMEKKMMLLYLTQKWGSRSRYTCLCVPFFSSGGKLFLAGTAICSANTPEHLTCVWCHDSHCRYKQERHEFLPSWSFECSGEDGHFDEEGSRDSVG